MMQSEGGKEPNSESQIQVTAHLCVQTQTHYTRPNKLITTHDTSGCQTLCHAPLWKKNIFHAPHPDRTVTQQVVFNLIETTFQKNERSSHLF